MSALPQDDQSDKPGATKRGFLFHAQVVAAITFLSRLLGLAREAVAAHFFGAGAIWSAFTVAFTLPNLFRKLLGEGALSAAFIPLYTKALREQDGAAARRFAAGSVHLQVSILLGLTLVGELVLWGLLRVDFERSDYRLAVRLAMVMLPYVVFVCAAALLGGILQVHGRFAAAAATAAALNVCLIGGTVWAGLTLDLSSEAGQVRGMYWLGGAVLVAGVVQVLMLAPGLRRLGYGLMLRAPIWTPEIRHMLLLTVPVAASAAVLQIGVLLDKAIAFALADAPGYDAFTLLGWSIAYPMQEGAAARLNFAQFLYQFPLGVFAVALATAIFPKLADGALDANRDGFRTTARRGINAALLIGLPASAGMMLVADPAVRLLFQSGRFTEADARWTALSTVIYSSAIWAFSVQQILNRAFYALKDLRTPLVWTFWNLVINVVVEIPLLWTPLAEAAMPVGTLVSFGIQTPVMLWILHRRLGGLGWQGGGRRVGAMLLATGVMSAACLGMMWLPVYPTGTGKLVWAGQVAVLMVVGAGVYYAALRLMGVEVAGLMRRRKVTQA